MWLLELIHRRHSPTNGGNRSLGLWEFTEQIGGGTFRSIVIVLICDVGQPMGALVLFVEYIAYLMIRGKLPSLCLTN
jgi:hypothetical protein